MFVLVMLDLVRELNDKKHENYIHSRKSPSMNAGFTIAVVGFNATVVTNSRVDCFSQLSM